MFFYFCLFFCFFFFFFNDTATTEIYTLSLHDALPILRAHTAAFRTVPRDGPIGDDDAAKAVAAAQHVGEQLAIVSRADRLDRPAVPRGAFEDRVRRHDPGGIGGKGAKEWSDVVLEVVA